MIPKQEMKIAACLRQDARARLTAISRKSCIPVSTLYDHIKKPERLAITRYTALLDFPMLGFGTRATMLLKAGKDQREELKDFLRKAVPVNSLWRINNGYDFMAECVFADLRELEEFCDRLEKQFGVKTKEVHLVVEELMREAFMSDPSLVEREVFHARTN